MRSEFPALTLTNCSFESDTIFKINWVYDKDRESEENIFGDSRMKFLVNWRLCKKSAIHFRFN